MNLSLKLTFVTTTSRPILFEHNCTVCMYSSGFKARQHLRSLAPVMNDNDGQMIFGDLGGLKLPDIRLTGEKKHRKNLTQETCPDRGSNPGPLRDKRACYHLLHSGEPFPSIALSFFPCVSLSFPQSKQLLLFFETFKIM